MSLNYNPHSTHCNQGEHLGSCKYGDADCPSMAQRYTFTQKAMVALEEHHIDAIRERGGQISDHYTYECDLHFEVGSDGQLNLIGVDGFELS